MSDSVELMSVIAKGDYTSELVSELTEKDKTANQMKLFLLAQAKRELQRVMKYMALLDKVEESYRNKVEELIDDDKLDLKGFSDTISVINGCLARSNGIIKSVLNDDSLNNIVIIDNSTNINNGIIGEDNSGLGLTDPDSRDRVNKVVSNVLNLIKEVSTDDIIEGDDINE